MSASDAAPLPRLGEVFFDVRGSSRSMRLSWYADTGVAVFSIWQGGMCTGTFRLPIGDLPRMIEILQQGPDGDDRARAGHRAERAWRSRELAGTGQREVPPEDLGYYQDAGGHHEDPPRPRPGPDYGQPGGTEYYGGQEDYGRQEDYGGQHGYGGERDRGYLPAGPAEPEFPGLPGGADYGQQRFVPPYVRGAVGEYGSDIPVRPAGRTEDPIRGAYRSEPVPDPSQAEDYLQRPWPETSYSDGPEYRLADPGSSPGGSGSARHSPGRHGNYPAEPDPPDPQYQTRLPADIDELTRDYPTWRSR